MHASFGSVGGTPLLLSMTGNGHSDVHEAPIARAGVRLVNNRLRIFNLIGLGDYPSHMLLGATIDLHAVLAIYPDLQDYRPSGNARGRRSFNRETTSKSRVQLLSFEKITSGSLAMTEKNRRISLVDPLLVTGNLRCGLGNDVWRCNEAR
nr:hypothetical protein Iba_chr04eCG19640 [Ipomoea batatas]